MAECTCGWTGQDMDTHASWCPAGGSAPMLSDKELADKLTDAEVRQRVGEAKNARALLWSQVTDRDVFLCGAKWMLEQIVAGKVRTASGVPGRAPTLPRRPTDDELRAWIERHDLGGISLSDARCVFEDAQSLHLADGVLASDGSKPE